MGALALISVAFEHVSALSFYGTYALESVVWALWCVGVARAVLSESASPPREWLAGVVWGLRAPWFLLLSAFFAGLLAYAAFGITNHFSIEFSFLVLVGALLLEFFWWSVSLLVQPRIAQGMPEIIDHVVFWRALSRRSIELVLKLLIVGFFAIFIGTVLIIQLAGLVETLCALRAPSLFWVTLFQRMIVALWYALYTIAGSYLYRFIIAQ